MGFELGRLRRAHWVMGGGAVALFIFMLLPWYGSSASSNSPVRGLQVAGTSTSGWETFTVQRWLWLLTIAGTLTVVAAVALGRRLELPFRQSAIASALGGLTTVCIFYRIIHHPAGAGGVPGFGFSYGIKYGIWLGLLAAIAIAVGGYLGLREEALASAEAGPRPDAGATPATPPTTSPAQRTAPTPGADRERGGKPPQRPPGGMPPMAGQPPPAGG